MSNCNFNEDPQGAAKAIALIPEQVLAGSPLVPRRRCPVLSSRPAGAETCRPQYWRRDDRN
jgi:hypothetical protein